ncbi:ABC transporter permease [Streptomyces sp. NPDC005393]|uniref:ABC transporter permease n=1 Tax=Streptomyces sp. NPDC005393 TaxID=3157041 RepID=UPI0033B099BE
MMCKDPVSAPLVATGQLRALTSTVLTGRAIRLSRRNLDAVLTAMLLPIMLMLVFVYFFGGAIDTGTEYVTYVVPGAMLLCAGFGSANTAVTVTHDMAGGIIDRFRSLDIGGTPIVTGHVAASVLRNTVATAMVFGVAFLIGCRPDASPLDWVAVEGILLMYILAISWLSACFGVIARSPEAAGGFTFVMMFLPYPSSAFVPIDTMPGRLHGFAEHQPVTPIIEALRALLLDRPVGDSAWQALAWCGGILAVAVALSGALFRSRTA